MNSKVLLGILATAIVCSFLLPSSGGGQSAAHLPEFVITDQNGAVLGAYSASSTLGTLSVMLVDSANDERFHIQIGTNYLRGADSNDVFYTNANCTGTPYVFAPSFFSSSIPGLRGSVYAIGADPTGMIDNRVVRGTTVNLGDNDAILNSRFRTNVATGPSCDAVDPGVDTVEAVEVMDLSTFVRPFIAH